MNKYLFQEEKNEMQRNAKTVKIEKKTYSNYMLSIQDSL